MVAWWYMQDVYLSQILIFSSGAVAVRETTPATPPASKVLQMSTEAGGRGGGAKSEPVEGVVMQLVGCLFVYYTKYYSS